MYAIRSYYVPFQHASGRVLRAMNRSGDAETYLRLIADIRSALPDATIRSTFLVGFPGETDEDFEALLDRPVPVERHVITSYSIHYTKLYETSGPREYSDGARYSPA